MVKGVLLYTKEEQHYECNLYYMLGAKMNHLIRPYIINGKDGSKLIVHPHILTAIAIPSKELSSKIEKLVSYLIYDSALSKKEKVFLQESVVNIIRKTHMDDNLPSIKYIKNKL